MMVHLVVSAGVPSLIPLGLSADLSPGTVFLLQLTFTWVEVTIKDEKEKNCEFSKTNVSMKIR